MVELEHVRRFSGGLRVRAHKTLSTAAPIATLPIPSELAVAMRQHAGVAARPIVGVGDRVRRGQTIGVAGGARSAAVHAPAAGSVLRLESRVVPTGTGLVDSICVVIATDGAANDAGHDEHRWPDGHLERLRAVRDAGIVGLGGAAFPASVKLEPQHPDTTLILNGAECEPYISCDDMLMRERAADVVAGARVLLELSGARRCFVAIEHDKEAALAAMRAALESDDDTRFVLAVLPTIYPAGGERQLIESLLGREVPPQAHPTDLGIVCQNVGTAFALAEYVNSGTPLVSRIVTVTGRGIRNPQNVIVPLGASIRTVIEYCGGYGDSVAKLILGGNMMGYALPSDDIPVTKSTNCILAMTADESSTGTVEWPCIRCGDCAAACPARLQPQALLRAARRSDLDALVGLGLEDCIECGCCDVACPSHIPLTAAFHASKTMLSTAREQASRAADADRHYAAHVTRIAAEAADAEREQRDLRAAMSRDADRRRAAIDAAVERVNRRRADHDTEGSP